MIIGFKKERFHCIFPFAFTTKFAKESDNEKCDYIGRIKRSDLAMMQRHVSQTEELKKCYKELKYFISTIKDKDERRELYNKLDKISFFILPIYKPKEGIIQ